MKTVRLLIFTLPAVIKRSENMYYKSIKGICYADIGDK